MQILFIAAVVTSTICSLLWIRAFFSDERAIQGVSHTTFLFMSVFFAAAAHFLSGAL